MAADRDIGLLVFTAVFGLLLAVFNRRLSELQLRCQEAFHKALRIPFKIGPFTRKMNRVSAVVVGIGMFGLSIFIGLQRLGWLQSILRLLRLDSDVG